MLLQKIILLYLVIIKIFKSKDKTNYLNRGRRRNLIYSKIIKISNNSLLEIKNQKINKKISFLLFLDLLSAKIEKKKKKFFFQKIN